MTAALIRAGADPNEHLPLARTPLMAAARTGKIDALKTLIDLGANVNAKETYRGTTALMWAADEAHAEAVRYLIERGADIKARSNPATRGRGPALGKANDPRKAVAAQGAALAAREASPDLGALRALTEGGAATGQRGNQGQRGAAPGQRGAAPGQRAAQAVDEAAPADQGDDAAAAAGFGRGRPEPTDGGGLTAMIYAARANDVESIKVLLAAGADVNEVSA